MASIGVAYNRAFMRTRSWSLKYSFVLNRKGGVWLILSHSRRQLSLHLLLQLLCQHFFFSVLLLHSWRSALEWCQLSFSFKQILHQITDFIYEETGGFGMLSCHLLYECA